MAPPVSLCLLKTSIRVGLGAETYFTSFPLMIPNAFVRLMLPVLKIFYTLVCVILILTCFNLRLKHLHNYSGLNDYGL